MEWLEGSVGNIALVVAIALCGFLFIYTGYGYLAGRKLRSRHALDVLRGKPGPICAVRLPLRDWGMIFDWSYFVNGEDRTIRIDPNAILKVRKELQKQIDYNLDALNEENQKRCS